MRLYTHTHTHTSSLIRKRENKEIWNKSQSDKGITLVALVVTIVVLLILAGITISYVMGDNSVFKKASEAKLKADIAQWKEKLELAKSPVFIEGLGTFNPDKYFDYIQQQGIINNKDTDVIDNGDGTYEVTTKPGYVFEIELMPNKEKPTDAEIEYIGQAGKLPPRVKSIKVTGKTGTSIDIEVEVIRLEDGKLSYYYKESEEPDSAYKEVKKEVTDLTATIGSLTDGKIYDIKVVVKNKNGENELVIKEAIQQLVKTITLDKATAMLNPNATIQLNATILPENAENKTLEWSSSNETAATVDNNGLVTAKANGNAIITVKATDGSEVQATCNITVKIPVESITLNRTKANVEPNGTLQLTATVNPSNATNKNVTWGSSNTTVATVSQTGMVTAVSGVTSGTTTITVTSDDDKTKTASCVITITDESDWQEIAKVAKMVAEDSGIHNRTSQIVKNGMTIKVGDIFKVKYNGITKNVRVIGFNHDILSNPTAAYGSDTTATTAGITFEFTGFLEADWETNGKKKINTSGYNIGGWAATSMRNYLEGTDGIGKISESCKANIKQVRKRYIKVDDATLNNNYSDDKLWLLSCSEIYTDSVGTDYKYGYAEAEEGIQYNFYYKIKPSAKKGELGIRKVHPSETASHGWWLRSPKANSYTEFCVISSEGNCQTYTASDTMYVSPCFCI